MPRQRTGLRVKHCTNVGRYEGGKCHKLIAVARDGWYIQTWNGGKWYAITNLRFARERDAVRAAQALTVAKLGTHGALARAEPLTVMELATRDLQW